MDELRAAATVAAGRAARAGPVTALRAWWASRRGQDDAERGQGLAEYALILALIAIVAIAALVFLGETISQALYTMINEAFTEVVCDILDLC